MRDTIGGGRVRRVHLRSGQPLDAAGQDGLAARLDGLGRLVEQAHGRRVAPCEAGAGVAAGLVVGRGQVPELGLTRPVDPGVQAGHVGEAQHDVARRLVADLQAHHVSTGDQIAERQRALARVDPEFQGLPEGDDPGRRRAGRQRWIQHGGGHERRHQAREVHVPLRRRLRERRVVRQQRGGRRPVADHGLAAVRVVGLIDGPVLCLGLRLGFLHLLRGGPLRADLERRDVDGGEIAALRAGDDDGPVGAAVDARRELHRPRLVPGSAVLALEPLVFVVHLPRELVALHGLLQLDLDRQRRAAFAADQLLAVVAQKQGGPRPILVLAGSTLPGFVGSMCLHDVSLLVSRTRTDPDFVTVAIRPPATMPR